MKTATQIHLQDVQSVYSGMEGELWELIMGEQIHIGGLQSSMDLADRAGLGAGMNGVDLCCCTGAGMRFLTRFRNVDFVTGVDATPKMVELGHERSSREGVGERTQFVLADVCESNLPSSSADFVWGEDAWCYVEDKPRLIAEASRIVKSGGQIAFTDWLEGPVPPSDEEAARFLSFMKFPSLASLEDYRQALESQQCEVLDAHDTGRFAPCIDLYLTMLDKQLTYDALKIVGFDMSVMQALGGEMKFVQQLAHEGKIIQGLMIARKL